MACNLVLPTSSFDSLTTYDERIWNSGNRVLDSGASGVRTRVQSKDPANLNFEFQSAEIKGGDLKISPNNLCHLKKFSNLTIGEWRSCSLKLYALCRHLPTCSPLRKFNSTVKPIRLNRNDVRQADQPVHRIRLLRAKGLKSPMKTIYKIVW